MTEIQIRDPFGTKTAPRRQDQEGDTRKGGRLTLKDGVWRKTYKVHEGQEAVLNGEKVYADGKGNWLKYERDRLTGDLVVRKVGKYDDNIRYETIDESQLSTSTSGSDIDSGENQDYGSRYRAAIESGRAYLDKSKDERKSAGSKAPVIEDKQAIPKEINTVESDTVGLSPEAQRYYEMKDKTIPEFEGRKSQLAEWANNFKHLAQKNYDERLQRGDEMARRADLGLTPETFSQVFKDDKMMSIIEKEYTPASDYQVPDFDPSSTNLNTIDKLRPGNFEYDPNYVDFSRNNTVPKEVVSVMEQLGI